MSEPKFPPMPAVLSTDEIKPFTRPTALVSKSEVDDLRAALEKIASTPGIPEVAYNVAADALCWARRHYPHDAWQSYEDLPLPEDDEIHAAFPTRSGRHDLYAQAMRMVGAKFTKGAVVALVNMLLHRAEKGQGTT